MTMELSSFTNRYSISKTLRFSLIPQGKTLEQFTACKLLESDKKRADEYKLVKKIIDRYHKDYIERRMSCYEFADGVLEHCADCYAKGDSDNLELAQMDLIQKISLHLKNTEEYKQLFGKELFKSLLPHFLSDETEKKMVENFSKFSTYFTGYYQNRENIYSGDNKATEIGRRVVVDNLPKFIDNIKTWEKIKAILPQDEIAAVDADMQEIIGLTGDEIFAVNSYSHFVTQSGIDKFNEYIGGYTNADGSKIQGLNEKINLFGQKTKQKLPKMKLLYKQILSDRDSISFIPETFESDNDVLQSLKLFYSEIKKSIDGMQSVFDNLSDYDLNHVYVKNGLDLSTLSNEVYGDWNAFRMAWSASYEKENPVPDDPKKKTKYEDEKDSAWKKQKNHAIGSLIDLVESYCDDYANINAVKKIREKSEVLYNAVEDAWNAFSAYFVLEEYPSEKKLTKDEKGIEVIKTFLDSLKDYQRFVLLLSGTSDNADKDSVFYGFFDGYADDIAVLNHVYDKVRNYMTAKPFSTDKFKLTFGRSDFLGGWAQPGEWGNQEAHFFEKDGQYYVFITSRSLKKNEWETPLSSTENLQKADYIEYYFQKPDNKNTPRLFVRSKGDAYAPAVKQYDLPLDEVIGIYDKGYFKTEYRKKDPDLYEKSLHALIDYFKLGFSRHDSYKCFTFDWKPTKDYKDIGEFYKDTVNSCYRLNRTPVNYNGLLQMVSDGKGFLFQIFNKDFSANSKGKPNLHTLYFRSLFDTSHPGHIRLQGGAEIFYRQASLKRQDTTIHPANEALENKNPLNDKKTSTFSYELIKDKRYTVDHFEIHIPVELNYTAGSNDLLNPYVKDAIAQTKNQYIIGIDRGERNLLYISVIDGNGAIVEQRSMNIVETAVNKIPCRTDYHALLDKKEKDRLDARREWKTIEGIKELKEGYLSQAVHEICKLVEKYGAMVVMENLNSGFKNARSAVEKSVYQKFEKMLCDKLNYMVDKDKCAIEAGGCLNGYQLAQAKTSYNDMRGQNGIIFYIPAWMTSKIDPTTGFADLLHPRYETIEKSREFFGAFDSIRYNAQTNMFEFAFDYSNFQRAEADYKKKWIVCTNGERIYTYRSDAQNGQFVSESVNLTQAIKRLLGKVIIDYAAGQDLRAAITAQNAAQFYRDLTRWLALTLQMRNSVTGTEEDYLLSPVRNANGEFFDSRIAPDTLPKDADANGAYNIARKGLWIVEQIKQSNDPANDKITLAMTNAQWLEYAQTHC